MLRDILSLFTTYIYVSLSQGQGIKNTGIKNQVQNIQTHLGHTGFIVSVGKRVANLEGRKELRVIVGDDLDIIAEANPVIEVVRLLNRDVDVGDARLIGYAILDLRVETRKCYCKC